MITITFCKKAEEFKSLQVLGHADSVAEGADLVCCSVSVLTINLINSLEQFTQADFELVQNEELGLIQVTFRKSPDADAVLLMNSYQLGIEMIAVQYEEWLNVKVKEV